jgi:hypothetical protein
MDKQNAYYNGMVFCLKMVQYSGACSSMLAGRRHNVKLNKPYKKRKNTWMIPLT